MSDDIVTRLRDRAYSFKAPDRLVEEAADVIEQLRLRWDIAEKRAIRLGMELAEVHRRDPSKSKERHAED
jgi:hypothetical protein